ncbi:hypothetical protein ACTFIY_007876 [Dictyostelium cf. discoideum]
MGNADTYQHINCQFIKNKIILYCKDCKVLLCNKCTKDHNDHDFDSLPIITDTIKSIEPSKLDLFKKRKPAQSLEELHGLMNKVVEIGAPEDNSIALPFKDRENQFGEIEMYLIEMFNYFFENNPERVNHYFLQCLTGSGIGKTRFVKECWKFLKKNRWNNYKLTQSIYCILILISMEVVMLFHLANFQELDITDSQEAIYFGDSKTNANLINIFSNDTKSVNLLCSCNTSIDIRINFKLQNAIGKKYLMVIINTKFSNRGTYLGKEGIDKIYENCINLENYYKDTYILPILITNFKVNKCHVEDSKGKAIIYHSKNIHLFYGKLWHRVLFDSHKSDFINTPDLCKQLENNISLQN